jgi:hypothetical protein
MGSVMLASARQDFAILAAALCTIGLTLQDQRPAAASAGGQAAGTCSQWDVSGTWQVQQAGGYTPTFSLQQSGQGVTGTLTFSEAERDRAGLSATTYTVAGTVIGAAFDVTVTGPDRRDGKPVKTEYVGTVSAGAIGDGVGHDLTFETSFSWSATGTAICPSPSGSAISPAASSWIDIGGNTAPSTIGCIYCDGHARWLAPQTNGTVYAGCMPTTFAPDCGETTAQRAEPAGTLSGLSVQVGPADAGYWNFAVWVNGAGTPIRCDLSPNQSACTDTTHTASINAGDKVELFIGNPGLAPSQGSFSVTWSLSLVSGGPPASSPPPPDSSGGSSPASTGSGGGSDWPTDWPPPTTPGTPSPGWPSPFRF